MDYRNVFEKMLNYFPSWSDIRKRHNTSNGGAIIRAYAMESDEIQKAIDDYKKSYFLINYTGKENDIPSSVIYAQIGDIDSSLLSIDNFTLAEDTSDFYINKTSKFYYYDGKILFHKDSNLKEFDTLEYYLGDKLYKAILFTADIWNIFDEFALFAGLSRYDNESNLELANRTYAVFRNPVSSNEHGIKNAIINSIKNYHTISYDDIIIEQPNELNMALKDDEFNSIYDKLLFYNKDSIRAKTWNTSYWENSFANIKYLPNVWDKEISQYQNGVGHNNSCKVDFIGNIEKEDVTDLSVSYYKKSQKAITEYIKNNNIETDISLKLIKYADTISSTDVDYKITATDVSKIDAKQIFIQSWVKKKGLKEYLISSLSPILHNVSEITRNKLDSAYLYKLKFTARSAYCNMNISECKFTNSTKNVKQDLRVEDSKFKFDIGHLNLFNTDVLAHIDSIDDVDTYYNMIDTNGITVDSVADYGEINIDITGMQNSLLNISSSCEEVNVTDNSAIVSYNGFSLVDDYTLHANGADSTSNIILDTKCNSYSFELAKASDPINQGSVEVMVYIDGRLVSDIVYNTPQIISKSFDSLTNVKVVIRKSGRSQVTIKNIKAARYDIELSLDNGNIIKNPMYMMLPSYSGKNTLRVKIVPYTQIAPVINYIHIGSSLINSSYSVELPSYDVNDDILIDIDTTCKVALYCSQDNGATYNIIDTDFVTYPKYINNTNNTGYITLNLSSFSNIEYSSPKIFNNGTEKYIELLPNESIDKILINGTYTKSVRSNSLHNYICNDIDDEVYVTKAVKGFLVKHSNDVVNIVEFSRSMLEDNDISICNIRNVPNDINNVFVFDNSDIIANTIDTGFDYIYMYGKTCNEYVAYNSSNLINNIKHNIEIVNTFYPILSLNNLLYFKIDVPNINTKSMSNVNFKKKDSNGKYYYEPWSLGSYNENITITTDIDLHNSDVYELDISQVSQKYILSNNIALNNSYVIDGEERELSEFIIEPPDGIEVLDSLEEFSEIIIAEEDMFNKLFYSNIDAIINIANSNTLTPISKSDYTLLKDEGIVIWNNEELIGMSVFIEYSYHKPRYLRYTNLDYLYNAISYSTDAYELVKTFRYVNLQDKSTIQIEYKEDEFDKIITKTSSANFESIVSDKYIVISKISDTNNLVIHNGYVYDNGNESWLFNNKYVDLHNQIGNVEFNNVKKINGTLELSEESSNLLPHSNMERNNFRELCRIDFRNRKFTNSNPVSFLGACNSYSGWASFNTKAVQLVKTDNGVGLEFICNENNSYSIFEVTDFLRDNSMLSIEVSGDIKCYIGYETLINNMAFNKSICVNNLLEMSKHDKFLYYMFEKVAKDLRYYICLKGDGVIDDITISDIDTLDNLSSLHTRNINKLGFKFDDVEDSNVVHEIYMNELYSNYNSLQVSKDNEISMASTVDYGMTLIEKVDLNRCVYDYFNYKNNYLYAEKDTIVTTPTIYIANTESIVKVVVKINDVFVDDMASFDITLFSSKNKNGLYAKAGYVNNSNILQVSKTKDMGGYYKVEIAAKSGKIINSIECYAVYGEVDGASLTINNNNYGTLETSVYDTGKSGNYRVKDIDMTTNNFSGVNIYVRACRLDKRDTVWTAWKNINSELADFNNYQFFQFKIELTGEETMVKLNKILLEDIG